ncbi:MAG: hypothetical protein K6B40_08885 [Firmicutes bacterium]|nr:hypothetical protein [Bacillota bacterium]
MLTAKPTPEMLQAWRRAYAQGRKNLKPNRKSGAELDRYFREKYRPSPYASAGFLRVVEANILENDFHRAKLPQGQLPEIAAYRLPHDVYVGIDLRSGYFHVESENTEQMAKVYDDLFFYRGLDAADLENVFLVAQYLAAAE